MKYYRDTNIGIVIKSCLLYLFIFVYIVLFKNMSFIVILSLTPLLFVHIIDILIVLVKVKKNIKDKQNIKDNGICQNGKIVSLVEYNVEKINKISKAESKKVYKLKVQLENSEKYVYSDILKNNVESHIDENVLVYELNGNTYVECKDSEIMTNYAVLESNKYLVTSTSRNFLVCLNKLLVFMYIITFIYMYQLRNLYHI